MVQKAPWWQTTRNTWMGFVLAVAFLILGGILVAVTGGDREAQLLRLSAGALFLLIGLMHLLSAIVMSRHRHDHRSPAADRHHHLPTAS